MSAGLSNPILALLQDPSILASLQNTLTPAGVLSQMQAAGEQEQAALAAKAKAASEAATAAGSQYQQAAAAPPPQLDPLSQSLPQLLGNVASTLTNDPGYASRAHQNVTQAHDDLIRARVQNLQALRESWDMKAKAAQDAGNLEATLTARTKSEQLSKTLDVLLQGQKEKAAQGLTEFNAGEEMKRLKQTGSNQIALERERGAQDRATLATKAKFDKTTNASVVNDYFSDPQFNKETRDGVKYFDATNVPADKNTRNAALAYASQNGRVFVNKDEASRLQAAEEVFRSLDDVSQVMTDILPQSGGAERVRKGAQNLMAAATRTGANAPAIAAFNNSQMEGIRVIQSLAAGAGSGFRLNQSEINMITKRWPQLTDDIGTARWKVFWDKRFIENKQRTFFGKPALPLPSYSDIASGKITAQDPADWEKKQSGAASSNSEDYRRR